MIFYIHVSKAAGMSDERIDIYTIGFTKKGAKKFFSLLESADIERLVDVRIRNRSQLAGFAKRDDLIFFLREILGVQYDHMEELAPTKELLDEWRDDEIEWTEYENRFYNLLSDREVENTLSKEDFEENTVLLCSEHEPEHCHRRLVVDYLNENWGGVEPIHLID